MEDLRAAIEDAERHEKRQAADDATLDATPGEASRAGAGEHVPADEGKLRPAREMGRSAGASGAATADATGRATTGAVSHEPVTEADSQ